VSNEPLSKVGSVAAADVCWRYAPPMATLRLLRRGMSVREMLEALAAKQEYTDAIDFLARALPAREGVWWGALCLQHACGDALTPHERAAGIAAIRWVIQPTPENSAAARGPGEAIGLTSPAGPLALAAAGGLDATPHAPAETVAMAVKLASLKAPGEKMTLTLRRYLELGIGVAEGRFA